MKKIKNTQLKIIAHCSIVHSRGGSAMDEHEIKTYYEKNFASFDEYVSDIKMKLYKNDTNYRDKYLQYKELKQQYPKILHFIEDYEANELTKEEVKILLKIREIKEDLQEQEMKAIFFEGGKEAYAYFKKIEIIN